MQYYSEDHVWVRVVGAAVTLGLSRHAAAELGELTFVELPGRGRRVARGDVLCVVESVKTAADVASPVSGVVCEVNERLVETPGLVNSSPEEDGWLCRLREVPDSDLADLIAPAAYAAALVRPNRP
jgi:glycine cleavage system H protein